MEASKTQPRDPQDKPVTRKHAFNPEPFSVVRIETPELVANLRADALATYQPVNSQEIFAVERIALAQVALLRISALEAGLFTCILDDAMERPGLPRILEQPDLTRDLTVADGQNRAYWIGAGFLRIARKCTAIQIFLRYQAQAERLYRRAVEDFDRLRALRSELPEQPVYPPEEPKPEEPKPEPKPEEPKPEPAAEPTPEPESPTPNEPTESLEPDKLPISSVFPSDGLPQSALPVTPFAQPLSESGGQADAVPQPERTFPPESGGLFARTGVPDRSNQRDGVPSVMATRPQRAIGGGLTEVSPWSG